MGFEFLHSHLHVLFRDLRGSVTRRLLIANGLDLVIMSVLTLLESLTSMRSICQTLFANPQALTCTTDFATPVLLQWILRSMDDPGADRINAVVYAILSLIVRLVASQSAVFNL